MRQKASVLLLSLAYLTVMLAGLSIAQNQTGNTGQGGNTNQGGTSSAGRQGSVTADSRFAMTAAQDSMAEVELGRLAVQRGVSEAVRQFGQRMIDDHTTANQQLMQLASTKGWTLPTSLDAKHAATLRKFQRLNGPEFDRQYIKQMVQDHRKAVDLFQREADRGMDADMKAFAAQTLPTLQEHLRMAQAMSGGSTAGMGRGSSVGNSNTGRTSGNANANGNMSGGMNMNSNSNMNSNRGGGGGNGNANSGTTNMNARGGNRNTGSAANRNANSNRNMNSNTGDNTNANTGNGNNSNRP